MAQEYDDLFWNAIGFGIDAEAHKDKQRLSGLSCRRIFSADILKREMETHLDHVRYVPELAFFRVEWFGYQRGNFNQRFKEMLNDDNDDPQEVLLNFMRPQTDQFYCFHCRKVVTGTINDVDDNYEVLCDRCLGWVLLEMNPEDLDEVPAPPINMAQLKTRLIPKELSPQLVAEPLENTFRSITVSEEDPVDDACPTCYQEFKDGETAVALMCNCNLFYHSGCFRELVTGWESRCPSCRQNLLTDDELYNVYLRSSHY